MTASPLRTADLTRASECEDHRWPASDGIRDRSAASERRERDHGRAICNGPFVSTRATGRAALKTEIWKTPVRLPALHFQSVGAPTDARGLRGFLLPAFRLGLKFIGRIFRAVRTRLPVRFHSALAVCQDTPRRSAEQSFHFHYLSAQEMGLAAGVYGQHTDRRKQKCPNQDGTNPYRNGVNAK